MSRPNVAIVGCFIALAAVAVVTALSDAWLSRFVEPSLGVGVVVVTTFFVSVAALTVGLAWSTVASALAWRAGKQRGTLNGAILASGAIFVLGLGAYLTTWMVA